MNSHQNKFLQRTISHDSSLKPKQLQHLQARASLTFNKNSSNNIRDELKSFRCKLVKQLASSGGCDSNTSNGTKRRTSVCRNVFEFEEDSMDFLSSSSSTMQHLNESESDKEDGDNDKENIDESIGKRISSMAISIVAKDGRELFGEMPTRKIPIANIVRTNQIYLQQQSPPH